MWRGGNAEHDLCGDYAGDDRGADQAGEPVSSQSRRNTPSGRDSVFRNVSLRWI